MKQITRLSAVLTASSIFCMVQTAPAQVKISGNISAHVNSTDLQMPSPDVRAEVRIRTKRYYDTRAVLKADGSLYHQAVRIEDAYLDYRPKKGNHIMIGASKKILGLEYQHGRKKRLTIYRSPIYRKMEALGLVGRQINLRTRWTTGPKKKKITIEATTGLNGSRDYNSMFSFRQRFGKFGYGAWLLAEAHRVDVGYMPIWGAVASVWYRRAFGDFVLETFSGKDAQRTELEGLWGRPRSVLFSGAKAIASLRLKLSPSSVLVPLVQSSFWLDDWKHPKGNSLQALVGLNLRFRGGAQVLVNAETIHEHSTIDGFGRSGSRQNIYLALRYVF